MTGNSEELLDSGSSDVDSVMSVGVQLGAGTCGGDLNSDCGVDNSCGDDLNSDCGVDNSLIPERGVVSSRSEYGSESTGSEYEGDSSCSEFEGDSSSSEDEENEPNTEMLAFKKRMRGHVLRTLAKKAQYFEPWESFKATFTEDVKTWEYLVPQHLRKHIPRSRHTAMKYVKDELIPFETIYCCSGCKKYIFIGTIYLSNNTYIWIHRHTNLVSDE